MGKSKDSSFVQAIIDANKAAAKAKPNRIAGERFKHLDKIGLSDNIKMKKLIEKKRKIKEDSRLFYKRAEQLKSQKAVVTRKVIERKRNLVDFQKSITSRIKRIKRRTLLKINLDKYQIRDCVEALKGFYLEKSEGVLGRKDYINVEVVITKKMEKITLKPTKIDLKCPIYSLEHESNIAMILSDNVKVKDEAKKWLVSKRITVFPYSKVVGWVKEKKLGKVIKSWDCIFCSDGIYNMLIRSCSKVFSKRNRMPYPVNTKSLLKEATREETLKDLLQGVYFVRSKGPQYELPAGRIRMSNKDNVKNIINLIYQFVPQILVQSPKNSTVLKVSLSVDDSKRLPVYSNDYLPEG